MQSTASGRKLRSKLSRQQKEALIPAGPVAPERKTHNDIETQILTESEKGTALVAGQRVATPVTRLLRAGAISLQEAQATQLFKSDHDAAYIACTNVLASIQVDNCGGSESLVLAQMRRAKHGQRFRRALAYLGEELDKVAVAAIICEHNKIRSVYQSIGLDCLPKEKSRAVTQGAGKGVLVIAIRKLASFYGYRSPNASRPILEAA